jgi:hypothetical protein
LFYPGPIGQGLRGFPPEDAHRRFGKRDPEILLESGFGVVIPLDDPIRDFGTHWETVVVLGVQGDHQKARKG